MRLLGMFRVNLEFFASDSLGAGLKPREQSYATIGYPDA